MVLDLLELPRPRHDHAHLARFEEAVHLQRIGRLVGVERLVLECHVTQQLQRLDPLRAAEERLLVGAVEHVPALLPDHRPEPPGRVLAARDRIAGADDVLARVRELLGQRAVVAPGPVRLRGSDARGLEDLRVVDDREVVDHGREADHLRADRRSLATGRIQAVPREAGRLDVLRDVDDLARLRHVRYVGAVHVGDVGIRVGADHGLQLLHHLVAARAQLVVHDDAGVRLVELHGELVDRLLRRVRLSVPERDLDRLVRGRSRPGGRGRDERGDTDRCDDERDLLHGALLGFRGRWRASLRLYSAPTVGRLPPGT